MNNIHKSPEFLDALCKRYESVGNWEVIEVEGFGDFVWCKNEPEKVYKVSDLESWLEGKQILLGNKCTIPVRQAIHTKAKIQYLRDLTLEIWLNIVIPTDIKSEIRVEAYTDSRSALSDADLELSKNAFEVHTKRVTVKVP